MESSGSVREMEEAARAFHEHAPGWPALLHEEIEVNLTVTYQRTVRGREMVVHALTEGRAALVYVGHVREVVALDDQAVLAVGSARYALEDGGLGQSDRVWLDEFEDDLIRRSRGFANEVDARHAYETQRHR